MLNSKKEFLSLFGWDDFFESQISDNISSSVFPARVICEEKGLYRVQVGNNQIFWAIITGKMMFNAQGRLDYPAVGDWVMVELPEKSDRMVIHKRLDRKTMLHRKVAGESSEAQILSSNVDYAFITSSLNDDLSYRRIERYLAVVKESGVTPVILFTKADIYRNDLQDLLESAQKEFVGVKVHTVSKECFEAAEFLKSYLAPGLTAVFLGSSGVGKSTLVNFLIGRDEVKTQSVREEDSKGRHTTTSRCLYISRYGGLIIDTPGMRELQLADHFEGLSSQFSDIEELIQSCRFRDCRHQTEPGCEVIKALDEGSLTFERWRSFHKLEAEIRHSVRKQDRAALIEKRKVWKKENGRQNTSSKRGDF